MLKHDFSFKPDKTNACWGPSEPQLLLAHGRLLRLRTVYRLGARPESIRRQSPALQPLLKLSASRVKIGVKARTTITKVLGTDQQVGRRGSMRIGGRWWEVLLG